MDYTNYRATAPYAAGTTNSGITAQGAIRPDAFTFDYITVETDEKFALEYVDCYQALGWEFIKAEPSFGIKTALTFKRNRKIQNKDRLNKIQIKIDEALKRINSFEFKKTRTPFIAALSVGIPALLVLGGGMSLCLLGPGIGAIIGGAFIGVAGLGLCGIGYLVYKKLNAKKTAEMNVQIDKKRDEVSLFCEEAQQFLK